MAKITSTFSDGTQDIYNGKRAVKAAWKVVTPAITMDGQTRESKTRMGHSFDLACAEKTARATAGELAPWREMGCKGKFTMAIVKYFNSAEFAPYRMGCKDVRAYNVLVKKLRADFIAGTKFEFVTL